MLIDSHCHLDLPPFDADRGAVWARARSAGVTQCVVPAVTAARWTSLTALCRDEPGLHATCGLHPLFMAEHRPGDLDALRGRLESGGAVAVGECGLDFHAGRDDAEYQIALFRGQLALALEFDLPVLVHARRALEEVILELRARPGLRGVVHSFSGSEEQAERLWSMGFAVGIGGPVTYERARRLRRIVASMPLRHLLLETDSPDQPLSGHQGERNEPARLPEVLDCIAMLRNEPAADIAAATSDNARALFDLGA